MRIWLSGIIPITNSNGDNVPPLNIPFWIFVSYKLFLPVVDSTLQVFMLFSIIYIYILYILRQFIIICGIIRIILLIVNFSYQRLRDIKSPPVSRTLLSIQANLTNAIVWMVSILLPISNCSGLHSNPFGTVTSTSIITGITVTCMFHTYF